MMHKLIPATFIATMIATPMMACPDWKVVAAFDAIIAANDKDDMDRGCLGGKWTSDTNCSGVLKSAGVHALDLANDRIRALADTCQENAR